MDRMPGRLGTAGRGVVCAGLMVLALAAAAGEGLADSHLATPPGALKDMPAGALPDSPVIGEPQKPDERGWTADQKATYERCLGDSQAVATAWEIIEQQCRDRVTRETEDLLPADPAE